MCVYGSSSPSRIKENKCVDPKYFCDERRVADERKLLTMAAEPQPVKIMLFNARSTDRNTHTKGEHSACVKVGSEFRGSCRLWAKVNLPPVY